MLKVWHLQDSVYQVVELEHCDETCQELTTILFQGSIAECEAWISLNRKGLL